MMLIEEKCDQCGAIFSGEGSRLYLNGDLHSTLCGRCAPGHSVTISTPTDGAEWIQWYGADSK